MISLRGFLACCRVIALAYKQLAGEQSAVEIRKMLRSDAESNLQFAGFAIFQCPLKPESEPALRMLRDSSHQVNEISELSKYILQHPHLGPACAD